MSSGNPNETSKPKKPKKPKPSPRRARRARGLGATWRRCARASRRRNKERETPSESFSGASGASGFSTRHHALPPVRRTDLRRGSRRSRFPRRTRAGNLGGKSRLQTIFADSRRPRRTKTRRTSTRPFRTTRFRPTPCRTKTKTRKSPATRGERDEAELRRQAAAAAMSAAETTPPRLITHTDGDATFDHLLERQERREERSSSLDPENVRHRVANPSDPFLWFPRCPPSAPWRMRVSRTTQVPRFRQFHRFRRVPCRGVVRGGRARGRAGEELFELFSARQRAAASAAASRWRSAYDSVAAAHETDSTRKKRSMYSRAAAAFGFAKKKPTARGRWQ